MSLEARLVFSAKHKQATLKSLDPDHSKQWPVKEIYNIDWLVPQEGAVHTCKSRAWFIDYIPFTCEVMTPFDGVLEAVRAGTVEIPVVRQDGYGALTLKNVLHVPDSDYNSISLTALGIGYSAGRTATDWFEFGLMLENYCVALLDIPAMWRPPRLRLVGMSEKHTSLRINRAYHLRNQIEFYDLCALLAACHSFNKKLRESEAGPVDENGQRVYAPPYTKWEKDWLRSRYANFSLEWEYLLHHNLMITDEGDCEEGRLGVRSQMYIEYLEATEKRRRLQETEGRILRVMNPDPEPQLVADEEEDEEGRPKTPFDDAERRVASLSKRVITLFR